MSTSPNRIVVGVDGSPCSLHALGWAMREAEASAASVAAVLVWSDPWSLVGPPSLFGAGKEGRAKLRAHLHDWVAAAARAEGAGKVPVTIHVVAGSPAETLVHESASARMLVVGTTGLTGLRRYVLGSVSQRCAQLSRVPVVIVPSPAVAGEGPEPAGATAGADPQAGW